MSLPCFSSFSFFIFRTKYVLFSVLDLFCEDPSAGPKSTYFSTVLSNGLRFSTHSPPFPPDIIPLVLVPRWKNFDPRIMIKPYNYHSFFISVRPALQCFKPLDPNAPKTGRISSDSNSLASLPVGGVPRQKFLLVTISDKDVRSRKNCTLYYKCFTHCFLEAKCVC